MNSPPQQFRARRYTWLGILVLLVFTSGCAGGQNVTPEAVENAKRLWTQANIRNYDLDWTIRGPNNAHYFVSVRDGEARKVEMVQRDGTKVELHFDGTRYYSVDGLFRTIADELALLKTDLPFGQPKGTKVIMRFLPDAKLGYPHFYRRDVLGTPLSISIDVNALTPAQ
jgi:hypothetical protein